MKNILYIALFLLPSMLLAQDFFDERWFFQASAHLNIPRKEKATYSYGVHFIDHLGRDASYGKEYKFREKVIYSTDFSTNYLFTRSLAVGAIVVIHHFRAPVTTALKAGIVVRGMLPKASYADIYGQLSGFIPLSKQVKASFGEAKIGLSIPIVVEDVFTVSVLIDASYTSFEVGKPILADEIPDTVEYRTLGIGFGIRF